MGDVTGRLNRRGYVQGMDDSPSGKIIELKFSWKCLNMPDVRKLVEGRASYAMEF